jgi:predicted aspartyl protease
LADGREVAMDVFEASVLWDNLERDVVVLEAEGVPLVGMALLSGYRVTLEVQGGGSVRIEALS